MCARLLIYFSFIWCIHVTCELVVANQSTNVINNADLPKMVSSTADKNWTTSRKPEVSTIRNVPFHGIDPTGVVYPADDENENHRPSNKEKRCRRTDPLYANEYFEENRHNSRRSLPQVRSDVFNKKRCDSCRERPICKSLGKCELCSKYCQDISNTTASEGLLGQIRRDDDNIPEGIRKVNDDSTLVATTADAAVKPDILSDSCHRYYSIAEFEPGPKHTLLTKLLNITKFDNLEKLVVLAKPSNAKVDSDHPVVIDTANVFKTNHENIPELNVEIYKADQNGTKKGPYDLIQKINHALDLAGEKRKEFLGDSQLTANETKEIIDHVLAEYQKINSGKDALMPTFFTAIKPRDSDKVLLSDNPLVSSTKQERSSDEDTESEYSSDSRQQESEELEDSELSSVETAYGPLVKLTPPSLRQNLNHIPNPIKQFDNNAEYNTRSKITPNSTEENNPILSANWYENKYDVVKNWFERNLATPNPQDSSRKRLISKFADLIHNDEFANSNAHVLNQQISKIIDDSLNVGETTGNAQKEFNHTLTDAEDYAGTNRINLPQKVEIQPPETLMEKNNLLSNSPQIIEVPPSSGKTHNVAPATHARKMKVYPKKLPKTDAPPLVNFPVIADEIRKIPDLIYEKAADLERTLALSKFLNEPEINMSLNKARNNEENFQEYLGSVQKRPSLMSDNLLSPTTDVTLDGDEFVGKEQNPLTTTTDEISNVNTEASDLPFINSGSNIQNQTIVAYANASSDTIENLRKLIEAQHGTKNKSPTQLNRNGTQNYEAGTFLSPEEIAEKINEFRSYANQQKSIELSNRPKNETGNVFSNIQHGIENKTVLFRPNETITPGILDDLKKSIDAQFIKNEEPSIKTENANLRTSENLNEDVNDTVACSKDESDEDYEQIIPASPYRESELKVGNPVLTSKLFNNNEIQQNGTSSAAPIPLRQLTDSFSPNTLEEIDHSHQNPKEKTKIQNVDKTTNYKINHNPSQIHKKKILSPNIVPFSQRKAQANRNPSKIFSISGQPNINTEPNILGNGEITTKHNEDVGRSKETSEEIDPMSPYRNAERDLEDENLQAENIGSKLLVTNTTANVSEEVGCSNEESVEMSQPIVPINSFRKPLDRETNSLDEFNEQPEVDGVSDENGINGNLVSTSTLPNDIEEVVNQPYRELNKHLTKQRPKSLTHNRLQPTPSRSTLLPHVRTAPASHGTNPSEDNESFSVPNDFSRLHIPHNSHDFRSFPSNTIANPRTIPNQFNPNFNTVSEPVIPNNFNSRFNAPLPKHFPFQQVSSNPFVPSHLQTRGRFPMELPSWPLLPMQSEMVGTVLDPAITSDESVSLEDKKISLIGKIIPLPNQNPQKPINERNFYFVADGLRLPLKMKTTHNGTFDISIDTKKVCNCGETNLDKNITVESAPFKDHRRNQDGNIHVHQIIPENINSTRRESFSNEAAIQQNEEIKMNEPDFNAPNFRLEGKTSELSKRSPKLQTSGHSGELVTVFNQLASVDLHGFSESEDYDDNKLKLNDYKTKYGYKKPPNSENKKNYYNDLENASEDVVQRRVKIVQDVLGWMKNLVVDKAKKFK